MDGDNTNYITFCFECGEDTEYYIRTEVMWWEHKDIRWNCLRKQAYCKQCNEPVYVPKIHDWNCDNRKKGFCLAYKKKYGCYPDWMTEELEASE